tara:strand:- start:128 stop:730 length:603 start_codon:yes stop_codon:yes gene_type:complete
METIARNMAEKLLLLPPAQYKAFYERYTKILGDKVELDNMWSELNKEESRLNVDLESCLKALEKGEEVPFPEVPQEYQEQMELFEDALITPSSKWKRHRNFEYVPKGYDEGGHVVRYLVNPEMVNDFRDKFKITSISDLGEEAGVSATVFSCINRKLPVYPSTFRLILDYFKTKMPEVTPQALCAGYVINTKTVKANGSI